MRETRLPTDVSERSWLWLIGGVAGVVLIFFLWSLEGVLNPFLLFWALVGILIPLRDTRAFWPIVATAAGLTAIWLLQETGSLLAPFVLAFVLAYILNPAVNLLARGRLSRTMAIVILCLPFLGAMAGGVAFGVPWVGAQVAEVASKTPILVDRATTWLEALGARLAAMDVPVLERPEVSGALEDLDAEAFARFLEDRRELLAERAWEGILGLGRGMVSVATVLGYLILTPVLTFYLLRDYERIVDGLVRLVPAGYGNTLTTFVRDYDRLLSSYLRGQVMVSLMVGTMTATGLWIAQIPYALFLGVIVAVFNIVPYLGVVLSLIPALVIAAATGDPGLSLVKVAFVYTLAQSIESAVIAPRIVGSATGLHPVWILLALAVGGFFFGFVGLLLAVPTAVGIRLSTALILERYNPTQSAGTPATSGTGP